jgi:hypothetical protein
MKGMKIMKIDFNENGMTINFDKVPKLLYFNEESKGVGQIFLNGVQRKNLQDVKIQARTRDEDGWPPLKYRIQYYEPGTKEPQFISNMKEELCIGVKILDLDIYKAFLEKVKTIVEDERIPESIRQEHMKTLLEFAGGFEKGE